MGKLHLVLGLSALIAINSICAQTICSKSKRREAFEQATATSQHFQLDCHLTFSSPGDVITKRIVFAGSKSSNVILNCNGGSINYTDFGDKNGYIDAVTIKSLKYGSDPLEGYSRPENTTIENCKINGSMRIKGMGSNGEAEAIKYSSRISGHTQRIRNSSPTGIVVQNTIINSVTGRIPLYIAPGVTYTYVSGSEFKGYSASVGIYLDTESGYNTFDGNYIHVSTDVREQVAIDSSNHNVFSSNLFSAINHGGIYLYRNRGEGGTIRHTSPQHNEIVFNKFYYKHYDGPNQAIVLGSRQGRRSYCSLDKGFPFGSSVSNLDHARYNIVTDNLFLNRNPSNYIDDEGDDNFVKFNRQVSSFVGL